MKRAAYTVMEQIREVIDGDKEGFVNTKVQVSTRMAGKERVVLVALRTPGLPLIASVVQPHRRPQWDSLQLCFGGQDNGNAAHYLNYTLEAFGPDRDVSWVSREKGELFVHRRGGIIYPLADTSTWFPGHKPSPYAQNYRALHRLLHSSYVDTWMVEP